MSEQSLTLLLDPLSLEQNTQQKVTDLINEASLHSSVTWAAHMTPTVDLVSIVGKAIAAYHNGNLLSPDLYPQLKAAEQQVTEWLLGKFKFNYGYFTAGSSYGNLEALWQARDNAKQSKYVYGSTACHYSIQKACDILGLTFVAIETDSLGRILPDALQRQCQQQAPVAIVLNVGTTSNGEIDPLDECISICQQAKAWCHIDAAWGGCLAFMDEFQPLISTMSRADSLCFDPHKTLCQPKPSGFVFYQTARPDLNSNASYLSQPPQKSISGSSGGELFLPLWLSLNVHGEQYFIDNIQQRLAQARQFATGLDEDVFWSHCSDTGIVCFSAKQPLDLSQLVDAGVFSTTMINAQPCYRAVFSTSSTNAEALLLQIKNHL